MKGGGDRKNSPLKDMQLMDEMLMNYLILVKTDEPLPLGENKEITKALMGKNAIEQKFYPASQNG